MLATLIIGLLMLLAVWLWRHGRNGHTHAAEGTISMVRQLGWIPILALFIAGLFFLMAGTNQTLFSLQSTREIAWGLLSFTVAIVLGFGGWVYGSRP